MEAYLPTEVIKAVEQRTDNDSDLIFFKDEKSEHNPMGNDVLVGPGKNVRYVWPVTPEEHQELAGYLGEGYNKDMVTTTYNNAPQEACKSCGTPSTFSDIVGTALKGGVHNPSFMLAAVKRRGPGDGVVHVIDCRSCGKQLSDSASMRLRKWKKLGLII